MRSAKLYQYQLPMDSGVILRNQRLVTRDGFIVELKEGDRCGFGEITPLPEFSHETLEQAQQQAEALIEQWVETGDMDLNAVSPSVAFGFSMAQLELSQVLPVEGNYQVAPLCSGDPDDLVVRLNQCLVIKLRKLK